MASKRRQRRKQCERKNPLTKDEAFGQAVAMRNRKGHTRAVLDAYPCPFGDHWHVGHRPKKVQQGITQRRNEERKRS